MKQGAREGARQSSISGLGRLCCWSKDSGSSPLSSRPPPPSSTRHPASFPGFFIYVCIPEEGLATSLVHCWGGGVRILPGPHEGLTAPPASPSWVLSLHHPSHHLPHLYPHPAHPRAHCQDFKVRSTRDAAESLERCVDFLPIALWTPEWARVGLTPFFPVFEDGELFRQL